MTVTPRRSWRFDGLLREAVRNVTTPGSRIRVALLAAVLLGPCLALFHALEWSRLDSQVARLEQQGWTTIIVTGNGADGEPAPVDGASCARQTSVSGTVLAATASEATFVQFAEYGGRSLPVVNLGVDPSLLPSAASISQDTSPIAGAIPIWIGSRLALQLHDLTTLTPSGSTTRYHIVGTVPDALRAAGFDENVVVPTPILATSSAARCLVRVIPSAMPAALTHVQAAVATNGVTATAQPVIRLADAHPYETYLGRVSRLLTVGAGVGFAMLIFALTRSRSSEIGLYRVVGTTALQMGILLGLELSLIHAAWVASATIAAVLITRFIDQPVLASVGYQYAAAAAGHLLSMLIVTHTATRRVDGLLKDR